MRLTCTLLMIFLLAVVPRALGQTKQKLSEAQLVLLELNEQAVLHAKMRRYEEAIASIREAIRREPRLSGLYKNLGVIYINWGRPADALEPLRQALKLEPDCGQSHFYLGVANTELGRHAEATKAYEDALRNGWTGADLYSNLGWSYYLIGQPKKALLPLQTAASLTTDDHKILNNLGVVYASLARYDEAAKTLREVLILKPGLALARYNLGWVYLAKNDRTAALEQYSILKTQASELSKDLYKRIYADFLTAVEK